jgi:UDP-N-acetyl-D-galactosamine dehydrogenase
MALDEAYFKGITSPDALLFDIKGIYRGKINELQYMSL